MNWLMAFVLCIISSLSSFLPLLTPNSFFFKQCFGVKISKKQVAQIYMVTGDLRYESYNFIYSILGASDSG